jgi:hypothetical protein
LRQKDYSPQFSLKHMAKDLRLALETAAELSLPLEQTAILKSIYDRGMAAGWSDDDFVGLMRLLDEENETSSDDAAPYQGGIEAPTGAAHCAA